MRINFNLKQTRREELTQLTLTLTVQGVRIRVYTKMRVRPGEWDKRKRRCLMESRIPLRRMRELQLCNERLEWMENRIRKIDREKAAKGVYLTRVDIRDVVKESCYVGKENTSPLSYLSMLVESYSNGISHRGLKGSTSSQTTYRVALKRLENFCKEKGFYLNSFDDFDRIFFADFTHYLYNYRFVRGGRVQHYSGITVVNTLKVIKNLLHQAYDNEVSENLYYNKVHTRAVCTASEKIYLKEEEIARIGKVEVCDQTEREVRDLFVLACYTALRISDLNQLGKAQIGEKTITLYQVKTKERVQIPILKEVKPLMESYAARGFPTLSETKANTVIKTLAERAGLTQDVVCRENRGGTVRVSCERKCSLVSFHTARRSCITNLFRRGYPVNYIMTLSGHRSLQALQRYIRASREDMTEAFIDLLEKHNDI